VNKARFLTGVRSFSGEIGSLAATLRAPRRRSAAARHVDVETDKERRDKDAAVPN